VCSSDLVAEVITGPDLFYGKDVIVSALRVPDGAPCFPAPSQTAGEGQGA
jgi:hypothetical protein